MNALIQIFFSVMRITLYQTEEGLVTVDRINYSILKRFAMKHQFMVRAGIFGVWGDSLKRYRRDPSACATTNDSLASGIIRCIS